ncbi:MAG: cell wall-active antibiotics response protein [Longimicrobiales bacterium]|nr:cell wall-active antibiotics response protein [Longimicrobiales bacterium]
MRKVVAVAVAAWVMNPMFAEAQEWRTVTMSQQLERNEEIRVQVEYGAGRFTVRSVDEGLLYRMNLRYDEDSFVPVAELSGDRLRLGVESLGRSVRMRNRQAGELELELARGIPIDLDLEFGAVKADIDLAGLALTDLDLSTGASESLITASEPNPVPMGTASFEAGAAEFHVTQLGNLNAERIEMDAGVGSITLGFGGRWKQDARVSIDMGLGSLELRIPEGLGVRLRKDSFLTALDSEGLIKRGDVYESLDFEDADYRIVIDLDAAFGSVTVVWIDPTN